MKYTALLLSDFSVRINFSCFEGEYHAMIEGNNTFLNTQTQYANMEKALKHLAENVLPRTATPVLKRWFVSDAVNHRELLQKAGNNHVAVSVVQQPPLNGTKVALWVYFVENAKVMAAGKNAVVMEHSAYRHMFDMQLHCHNESEVIQTGEIFREYNTRLEQRGCTLVGNAVRTWIFVQSVDTHYADMAKARTLYFAGKGLNEHTHYIASTGIEGKYIHPETTVLMDAYAIEGTGSKQVTYLKGATHLNPTQEYGVTFERATAVDYGDRRHIFVSGTASINNRGQIVFPLDIYKQTGRMLENVEVLLSEGGATMADVAQMIVYLRDTADYHTVSEYFEAKYPGIPKVIVLAPVCRPGWLVEVECIAVCKSANKNYAVF